MQVHRLTAAINDPKKPAFKEYYPFRVCFIFKEDDDECFVLTDKNLFSEENDNCLQEYATKLTNEEYRKLKDNLADYKTDGNLELLNEIFVL